MNEIKIPGFALLSSNRAGPSLPGVKASSNTVTSSRGQFQSRSPSKKARDVRQPVPDSAVDLSVLTQCASSFKPANYADLIAANKVPEKVKSLCWRLQVLTGIIPRELKADCCFHAVLFCSVLVFSAVAAHANAMTESLPYRGEDPAKERCRTLPRVTLGGYGVFS